MKEDVPILKKSNIMDYSLLLAIEKNPRYQMKGNSMKSQNSDMDENGPSVLPQIPDLNKAQSANAVNPSADSYTQAMLGFKGSRHKFLSSNGAFIYHIAIIDYLQDYNWDKWGENLFKTVWRGRNKEISAVPPLRYSNRYLKFMDTYVIKEDSQRQRAKTSSSTGLLSRRET